MSTPLQIPDQNVTNKDVQFIAKVLYDSSVAGEDKERLCRELNLPSAKIRELTQTQGNNSYVFWCRGIEYWMAKTEAENRKLRVLYQAVASVDRVAADQLLEEWPNRRKSAKKRTLLRQAEAHQSHETDVEMKLTNPTEKNDLESQEQNERSKFSKILREHRMPIGIIGGILIIIIIGVSVAIVIKQRQGNPVSESLGEKLLAKPTESPDQMTAIPRAEMSSRIQVANKPNPVVNELGIFERDCDHGGSCVFSEELNLSCSTYDNKCKCRKEKVPLLMHNWTFREIWNLSYNATTKKCTVSKFGPCGKKNGFEIGCYNGAMENLTCIEGSCLDPKRLIGKAGESCQLDKHCKKGLLCSANHKCITQFSQKQGENCRRREECLLNLNCQLSRTRTCAELRSLGKSCENGTSIMRPDCRE